MQRDTEMSLMMNRTDTNDIKVINTDFMVEVQRGHWWILSPSAIS